MLSEISRKLNEKTSVKKIIDRLSRNLGNFNNGKILFGNYLKVAVGNRYLSEKAVRFNDKAVDN